MTRIEVLVKKECSNEWKSESIPQSGGLQRLVGGSIDCISLPHNIDLWLNDEGNDFMKANLMLMWRSAPEHHQYIFGPVVLAGVNNNGQTISLNNYQRKWIANHLKIGKLTNGTKLVVIDLTDGGAIA
ncbi:DUF3846 domain-containing protein [Cytobacillus gottheilii]|uniref:DUF3846 domain-containing protein n=1 Tax=Cytobacillus gottheilii TaxID=859144 RepID=UPI0024959EAE|nr:DUF3846 domain-containing protein [Cytobacillus gottheilii]